MDEQIHPHRAPQRREVRDKKPTRNLLEKHTSAIETRTALLPIMSPLVVIALALLMWASKLPAINLTQMSDLGLVSVLPQTFFVALLLLTLSFCASLRRRDVSTPLLLLNLFALIVILYGTPSLIEEVPRFESVWKHVGVSEYISRTGSVAPEVSAYFNWPAFFVMISFGTGAFGASDPLGLAMWFPLIISVACLGPLLLILRSATTDGRVIWLAAWFFYIANWIGQDYFSPQALNYFLYLVIIAILLSWFKARSVVKPEPPQGAGQKPMFARIGLDWGRQWLTAPEMVPNTTSSAGQRAGLMAILLTLFITIVASHQLTPFAIVSSVAVLVLLGRTKPRGLPVLLTVLTATWLSFMAGAFLAGNAAGLLADLGRISNSVDSNLTNRLRGSPEHIIVLYARLAMSIAIWGLALVGGLRTLQRGERPMTYVILAITPFVLVVLQPYGGEMLLRVYLFVLPFMAFFAARAFYATPQTGRSWLTTAAIAVVSLVLLGGFLVTRYGNERMDNFTAAEVTALSEFYAIAEPDSLFMEVSENMPLRFRDFEKFTYTVLPTNIETGDVGQLVAQMEQGDFNQRYLILTRSQRASIEQTYGIPRDVWDRFDASVRASSRLRPIVVNDDVQVYLLVDDRTVQP